VSKLGQGTYSEVLLGCSVSNNQPCVIKILKPAAIDKHSREIKILQILYGGPNIVKMWDAIVRGKTVCLVFEVVERGEEWKVFD
jgi:casein kinase II subunit alpha